MKHNFAWLKPESPFHRFFEDGKAPIKNIFQPSKVSLVGSEERDAYLLDWSRCNTVQRTQIAAAIAAQFGSVTPTTFLEFMRKGGDLPIRVSSTTSASLGAEMRNFL